MDKAQDADQSAPMVENYVKIVTGSDNVTLTIGGHLADYYLEAAGFVERKVTGRNHLPYTLYTIESSDRAYDRDEALLYALATVATYR